MQWQYFVHKNLRPQSFPYEHNKYKYKCRGGGGGQRRHFRHHNSPAQTGNQSHSTMRRQPNLHRNTNGNRHCKLHSIEGRRLRLQIKPSQKTHPNTTRQMGRRQHRLPRERNRLISLHSGSTHLHFRRQRPPADFIHGQN